MTDQQFVSLYRRFRPGRFSELRGQEHVVRALRGAVRDNKVSHAYLFSGPRGTGKTSSARILAKALNCDAQVDGEPCGVCSSCTEIALGNSLDVHELDAASNNGVDAMRDLVAHAALGTPGRWKIYIVDEVHMLSTAAANALLKTLEEPPNHVVFVLATTDPQKVPPTIRSRTQHLEFRLLGSDTLHDLLDAVRDQAGLDVDEDSVNAAVRRGRGSARDALSALDQIAASGSAESARPGLDTVIEAVVANDAGGALAALNALLAGGWGPQQLATELIDDLRQLFLVSLAPDLCASSGAERQRVEAVAQTMGLPRVVRSLETVGRAVVDMRDAPDPQVVLEIALVRAAQPDLDGGSEALIQRVEALERSLATLTTARSADASPVVTTANDSSTAPPGRRPSLGAVRRRQQAEADPPPPMPALAPTPPRTDRTANASADEPPRSETMTIAIDRDSLTQAWGDGILGGLPAKVKAAFSAGRFLSAEKNVARFALPHEAHREYCSKLSATVEEALSAHFGSRVRLDLVVDADSKPSRTESVSPTDVSAEPTVEDEGDEVLQMQDVAQSGADHESQAEARLLQAFPGTTEVS